LRSLDEMKGAIQAAWLRDQQEMRDLEARRYRFGCRIGRYGGGWPSYDWYWEPAGEIRSIVPKLEQLSEDQIRWWYIALQDAR
jgi:hypothetical protein